MVQSIWIKAGRHLIWLCLAWLVVTSLVFVIPKFSSENFVDRMINQMDSSTLNQNRIESIRSDLQIAYRLDKPHFEQWFYFVKNSFLGDFGSSSTQYPTRVLDIVWDPILSTTQLLSISLLLGWIIGSLFGARLIKNKSHLNSYIIQSLNYLKVVPAFIVCIAFAYMNSLIKPWTSLPLFTSLIPYIALGFTVFVQQAYRMTDRLKKDLTLPHVQFSRIMGIPQLQSYRSLYISLLAPQFRQLIANSGQYLSGAILIEILCHRQGVGSVLVQAITSHDIPLMQGTILTITALGIFIYWITKVCLSSAEQREYL